MMQPLVKSALPDLPVGSREKHDEIFAHISALCFCRGIAGGCRVVLVAQEQGEPSVLVILGGGPKIPVFVAMNVRPHRTWSDWSMKVPTSTAMLGHPGWTLQRASFFTGLEVPEHHAHLVDRAAEKETEGVRNLGPARGCPRTLDACRPTPALWCRAIRFWATRLG